MKQLEASGSAEEKAKFQDIWAQVRAGWRPVERMAREYASPVFRTYLDNYHAYLSRQSDKTRAELHRETDLFRRLEKSTLGPQRQGVINDMLGFHTEAEQLKHEFYADLGLATITSLEKLYDNRVHSAIQALEGSIGGSNTHLWSSSLLGVLISSQSGVPAVATTLETVMHTDEFAKAREENSNIRSFAAAVHGASDASLNFVNMLTTAKALELAPIAKAGAEKSAMYLHIVALGLDNAMIDKSFERLAQAEKRMRSVELSEFSWQQRIKVSTEKLERTERRLNYLNVEMAQQKRIADLYNQIRTQTP